MRGDSRHLRIAARVLVLSTIASTPLLAQRGDSTVVNEYAVKFVCGRTPAAQQSVARGQYFTAINVHNPMDTVTRYRWKVALTRTDTTSGIDPVPGPVSKFTMGFLQPDQAVEIDCRHIMPRVQSLLRVSFAKGFVIIQALPHPAPFWRLLELDVVGVYTTHGPTAVIQTMALQRVPVRLVVTRP